ncbi:MAG: response regulator transcription factor [Acidobacteriota bacterium]
MQSAKAGSASRGLALVDTARKTAVQEPEAQEAEAASEWARAAGRPRKRRPIRVMLVDDHLVVRDGLAALLRQELDLEVVAEAGDGKQAIERARQEQPDVILMDIMMPEMDGIVATRIIKSLLPKVKIIGLSLFEERHMRQSMLEAGASAYVSKSEGAQHLVETIRRCFKEDAVE